MVMEENACTSFVWDTFMKNPEARHGMERAGFKAYLPSPTEKTEQVPPRAKFELATLRLTADCVKNLSAASGVAYIRLGAILLSLVAPNPAPKVCYWQRASGSRPALY